MTKQYDALVLIGRFQPCHDAHVEIIRRAALLADKLIIIVGSADQPRTYKNPWTSKEREHMLRRAISTIDEVSANRTQVIIEHNIDTVYNNQAWIGRIQSIVLKHQDPTGRVAIIGHKKDSSSFYLDQFPQWPLEQVGLIEPLNATDIRNLYFRQDANLKFIRSVVPPVVYQYLEDWIDSAERDQIIREREFVDTYRKQYSSIPYAPVFVTTDNVVLCSGHVLLIKRKAEPGRGLWALPGGFLDAARDVSLKDAAIRELKEETRIKVPVPVLMGSITNSRVFDAIDRSARGRTITHAYKIELADGELPRIKGGDDAAQAKWVPLSQVKSNNMFEDHYDIVMWAVGG
jgi:bifunctional NMN adenylyltransferase/nudix hydrolase